MEKKARGVPRIYRPRQKRYRSDPGQHALNIDRMMGDLCQLQRQELMPSYRFQEIERIKAVLDDLGDWLRDKSKPERKTDDE